MTNKELSEEVTYIDGDQRTRRSQPGEQTKWAFQAEGTVSVKALWWKEVWSVLGNEGPGGGESAFEL